MLRRLIRPPLWAFSLAILVVPAASSASSPDSLYSSMLIAAAQQKSVHYTSVQDCGCTSAAHIVQVTDVASNQGIQRITVTAGGQTSHVTVLVTGGNAYVLGDSFALTNYMGTSPTPPRPTRSDGS